ncbi:MAG: glycoside hydrolase family 88 protein [Sphaerochaeta sp.]|uniref:glycoside hydrolase family 88 protein n=2 Tax=Sphaerochaeta sp. TaxID=1972642 RepID=UPI002582EE98|nr:glycoside hydrolase family 88 protein [Sphaerochaeta sp.]MDD2394701.1 glycoside hydrolase family 88 protein [Sphaerochaeta sp.]MDD4037686.1 glycoside hydrolase family 88 protein [Sphaerochaeta sp.]
MKQQQNLPDPQTLHKIWEEAYNYVIEKIRNNITFFTDGYPAPASTQNVYEKIANIEWTSSFYNGMLYLAYLHTKDTIFMAAAEKTLPDYQSRLEKRINTNTHDLGFLYILSAKAHFLITGSEEAKQTALDAADLLMERYSRQAGIIQAWGDLDDPQQRGRIIIDCLMNLPLLFWATEVTGNDVYKDAALNHLSQSRKTLIRADNTTFHTYYFDSESGTPLRGITAQGYSDDSCWARGQAWGIYGLALAYTYTQDTGCLEDSMRLADYFLAHLPDDLICYWDLIFTEGDEERDSSACAIAINGLLLLSSLLDKHDEKALWYRTKALAMLHKLCTSYTSASIPQSNGILLHAVYGKPNGAGIDECTIWGDYFYMEALGTLLGTAIQFW